MTSTHPNDDAGQPKVGLESAAVTLRLLVTGGTGVLGRTFAPLARGAGHDLRTPNKDELDLFDPAAVASAVRDADGVIHLASRIRPLEQLEDTEAWFENDRLRADASRTLVGAALDADVEVYVQPTVTFVYPPEGPVSETTPIGDVWPTLRSALVAERQTDRFARHGRRGIVLRFGLLDGPGTGHTEPIGTYGATLNVTDAARALLSALTVNSGIYNVCRDGERVSNARFTAVTGWHPRAGGTEGEGADRTTEASR